MIDQYNRSITYLRISVTDLCNYRCIYCMGSDGVRKKSHADILSIEDMTEIAKTAYELGVRKIRLTGGEPLIRKGIVSLCENIRAISDDIELCLTTNGSLLPHYAPLFKKAGVDRLNISLDTLDPARFREITRIGDLNDVLRGIDAALSAGFEPIKINTVLMGGINDGDIPALVGLCKDRPLFLRFIELMPLGVCADWDKRRFISADCVSEQFEGVKEIMSDGVSRVYRIDGYMGSIGVITPMSDRFCHVCNRIRVTADGMLKPCLHSDDEISLSGLHGDALKAAMIEGVNRKPECHHLIDSGAETARNMNEIGG